VATVTTLPADEDYARALLTIFTAKGVRARQSLRAREVETAFLAGNMGRRDDFGAALQYATDQGWLTPSLGAIRLTAAGAEER